MTPKQHVIKTVAFHDRHINYMRFDIFNVEIIHCGST